MLHRMLVQLGVLHQKHNLIAVCVQVCLGCWLWKKLFGWLPWLTSIFTLFVLAVMSTVYVTKVMPQMQRDSVRQTMQPLYEAVIAKQHAPPAQATTAATPKGS